MTPEQVAAEIRKYAAEAGASDLAPLLVAIAKQESGLNPKAKGDGGHSWGLYQENDNGRGHGIAIAERQDIRASTRRAISEIRVTQRANPDADPGTLAILAQRPAENVRTDYRANINASMREPSPQAQRAAAGAQTAARKAAVFNGTYVMPVDGPVTNPYGGKQAYSAGKTTDIGNVNRGVDLGGSGDVRAPVGGTVVEVYSSAHDDRKGERDAEENKGWGGSIVIRGDDGKTHRLSHAQYGSIIVKKGQRIEQGQITHKAGMSGNATGVHVDWEVVDEKGQHVNPMAAPAMRSSDAKKILAQQGIPDRADQGAGNVSQSAGNPAQAQVDEFTRQRADIQSRIKSTELQLVAARSRKDAAKTPSEKGMAQAEIDTLMAQMADLQEIDRAVGADLAKAKTIQSGKVIDPDERDQMQAQTERIRAETAALQQKLENGGLTPLEEASIRSQIADRNSMIRSREAMLGAQVRSENAGAARVEQQTAEEQATLPYRIDYTLSQTDVNDAQAQRIRETLPLELDKVRQEIDRINQLTPIEIEQGRANVDLTRQRAEETRRMLQPTIDRIATQNRLDTANIARIVQSLPLELAQQAAETQLTRANVGLVGANTERVTAETQLTKLQGAAEAERQRRWGAVEQQIRDNPGMSADQVNSLVLGAANSLQDWAAAYRTQLDTQIARQNAVFQTQQNQMSQQSADVAQFSAAQQADIGQQNARTNQVNALENTAAPSGPTRRMARMYAAGSLGGVPAIEEQARGGRVGASELNAARAGFQQFQDMLGRIRSQAGEIRRAPDVTAPPSINIGFTPPTMPTSPMTSMAPPPSAVAPQVAPLAPPSNPFAFIPPTLSPEEIRRNRVSLGRGGV